MKKTKYLLLTGLLCSITTLTAKAQFSFGPRVGVNSAKAILDYESDDAFETKMRLGAQVGLQLSAEFGHLAIQPAILYSQKGYDIDYVLDINGYKTAFIGSAKLNYVEVPINFVYTTGDKQGLQLFAGPYIEYGLNGKYQEVRSFPNSNTPNYTYKRVGDVEFVEKEGTDKTKVYFRQVNLGANVGVGYKAGPVQTQLGYGFGLTNILPEGGTYDNKQYSRVLHLSLAYLFNMGSE
jgi:hypothetical protein